MPRTTSVAPFTPGLSEPRRISPTSRGCCCSASPGLSSLRWHPAALVEDVVKFPLGLGRQRTAAETPTLGSWLVRTFPSARVPLTAALVGVVAGLAVIVLFRGLRRTPAQAARDAGLVFLLAL